MTTLLPELGSVHLRETETELVLELALPPEIDAARMTARLRDRVLTITLPRRGRRHIAGFNPEAAGV